MTRYTVHWPEMGIDSSAKDTEGSDDAVKKWTEHPTLRKILLAVYFVGEIIRVVATSLVAGVLLVSASHLLSFSSNTAIIWGFITALALVMIIDEGVNKLTGFSIRYGSFLSSIFVVVSLVRLYLSYVERRNSLDDPSRLASALPIESIPILELYKRRNQLR